MFRVLKPPQNPTEAINGRRNHCYGFTIVTSFEENPALTTLLRKTRDKILDIIDPDRHTKSRPIRSPQYIKQKFFHASVFGSQILLDRQEFIEIYANKDGLLNKDVMDSMC
jgi:hypothetical protein